MSYSIELIDKTTQRAVTVARHTEGNTYPIYGTDNATIDITYNYAPFYYWALDKKKGIRWLYGKTGKRAIRRLQRAIAKLEALGGKQAYKDYWAPTPGNAAHDLRILLGWARQYPAAIFEGG